MKDKLDIRVEIDPSCRVPQLVIKTDQKTEYIENMVYSIERCLEGDYPQIIANDGDTVVLLNQWDIVRAYTENRKLIICTDTDKYESKLTLHEMENILDESYFVRISRFEIVNLKKVFSFDLSITGTIRITFMNKADTWVARRYVRAISEKLNSISKGR